jgi:hypothetical protein
MKAQPAPERTKPPEDRFKELGRKIMSVPKAEVDARDKAWHAGRRKAAKRKAT